MPGVLSFSDNSLTTIATKLSKKRYLSIEMVCVSMIPGATYDFFVDGINLNAFCKPFGGDLGSPLKSGANGSLIFQWHACIQYLQEYLTNKTDISGLMDTVKVLELRDPFGASSFTYLPIGIKAAS